MLEQLLDHLVGSHLHNLRHRKAKRLGGLEVGYQIELGRLDDRQVGRLFALENFADIDASLAVAVGKVRPVTDEPTGSNIVSLRINHRDRMSRCERHEFLDKAEKDRILRDEKCTRTLLNKRREGGLDVRLATG